MMNENSPQNDDALSVKVGWLTLIIFASFAVFTLIALI